MSLTFNLTFVLAKHHFGSVDGAGEMIIFKSILIKRF